MFGKLSEAIRLLAGNFLLIAMLVLTVWLPGNLLLNYLVFFVLGPDNTYDLLRVSVLIEGVLGPLYVGGMIYALWQIKQEQPVGFGEAIGAGFEAWGRVFSVRLAASFMVLAGLIAFVIPGVILILRYMLLDCAAVIEKAGSSQARRRSAYLMKGIQLQILGMVVVFYAGFLLLTAIVYTPLIVIEQIGQVGVPIVMILNVAADCMLDVAFAVLQIALFLYYWDKRQAELLASIPSSDKDPCIDAVFQPSELEDDHNPYRSPHNGYR